MVDSIADVNPLIPKPKAFTSVLSEQGLGNKVTLAADTQIAQYEEAEANKAIAQVNTARSTLGQKQAELTQKKAERGRMEQQKSELTSRVSSLQSQLSQLRGELNSINTAPPPVAQQPIQQQPYQQQVSQQPTQDNETMRKYYAAISFDSAARRKPNYVEFGTGVKTRTDGKRVRVDETGRHYYEVDSAGNRVSGGVSGTTAPSHGAMIDSAWDSQVLSELGMTRTL